jgi:hypothetical protein
MSLLQASGRRVDESMDRPSTLTWLGCRDCVAPPRPSCRLRSPNRPEPIANREAGGPKGRWFKSSRPDKNLQIAYFRSPRHWQTRVWGPISCASATGIRVMRRIGLIHSGVASDARRTGVQTEGKVAREESEAADEDRRWPHQPPRRAPAEFSVSPGAVGRNLRQLLEHRLLLAAVGDLSLELPG